MANKNLRSSVSIEFLAEGYLDEDAVLEEEAVESSLFYVDQDTGILYVRVPGVDGAEDTWVSQGGLVSTYGDPPEDVGTAAAGTAGELAARGDHVHGHGDQGTLASAHDAEGIDVADAAGHFDATNVETAIAEAYDDFESHAGDADAHHAESHAITSHSDANMTPGAGTDGYVIKWDDTAGEFVLAAEALSSLDLDDLADVDAPTPSNGEALIFNSVSGNWENAAAPAPDLSAADLADVGDVDTTGIADGDMLVWDTGTSTWIVATPATSIAALDDVGDVDTTGIADGDMLVWDTGTSTWVVATPTAPYVLDLSGSDLTDIGDVDTTGIADGDMLVWDAGTSTWVVATPSAGVTDHGDLTGLTDDDHTQYALMVTQDAEPSAPARDEALWYDSDAVATTMAAPSLDELSDVDAAAPDHGDVLAWDDGAGEWGPVPRVKAFGVYDASAAAVNPTPTSDTLVPDLATLSVTVDVTSTLVLAYDARITKGTDSHRVRCSIYVSGGYNAVVTRYSQPVGESSIHEVHAERVLTGVPAGSYDITAKFNAAIGTSSSTFSSQSLHCIVAPE